MAEAFRLSNPFRRVVAVQFAAGGPWDFYFYVSGTGLTLAEATAIAADPVQLEAWANERGFTSATINALATLLGISVPQVLLLIDGLAQSLGLAKISGSAKVLSPAIAPANLLASASYQKAFAVCLSGGQWKLIDPTRQVTRLRDGQFDARTSAFQHFGANASKWAIVAYKTESGPTDDLMVTEDTSTIITRDNVTTGFFQTLDNFFFADYTWDFGTPANGRIRIYGANEQASVLDTTGLELDPKIASTLRDVVFAMYGNDAGVQPFAPSFWSARNGLIGSPSPAPVYGGGTGVHYDIPHGRSVCTDSSYFLFDFENVVEHNELTPAQNVVTLGITKVAATVNGGGGLDYTVTRTPVVFNTEEEFDGTNNTSRLDILGVVATRTKAFMFFAICPPGGAEAVFHLMLVDSDGNLTTLDTNFNLRRPGDTRLQEVLSGATKDKPWLLLLHEPTALGDDRTALIYNDSGLIYTSPAGQFAPVGAAISAIGNTNDRAFFKIPGASGETFIVEGDGTTFDIETLITSSAGLAALPVTDKDTIYNIAMNTGTNKLMHVTAGPPAPAVMEYAFTGTIANIGVPARSGIMRMQEFEAWAEA